MAGQGVGGNGGASTTSIKGGDGGGIYAPGTAYVSGRQKMATAGTAAPFSRIQARMVLGRPRSRRPRRRRWNRRGGFGGCGTHAPGGGAPTDTLAPTLTSVSLTNRIFAVNRRGKVETPVTAAKKGTTFRYTLSEAARVLFTIQRATVGRRVGGVCRKQTRSNRTRPKCTRYVRAGRFAEQSGAGPNRKKFSGKIGRRSLKPGKYRATLVATDAAGNRSAPKRLKFKIVRR